VYALFKQATIGDVNEGESFIFFGSGLGNQTQKRPEKKTPTPSPYQ